MKEMKTKEILQQCIIQLQYLNDRFGEMSTTKSMMARIEHHINELDASQFRQEWIPVEERLPEIAQIVNITLAHSKNDVYSGFRASGGWYCFVIGENSKYFIPNNNGAATITAWQPLPQPYSPTKS